jgi:hypothetical protein
VTATAERVSAEPGRQNSAAAFAAALLFVVIGAAVERALWVRIELPSITSLVLIANLGAGRALKRPFLLPADRVFLLGFLAAAAAVLYSTALGFVAGDIYRAGFSPWAPVVLAIAAAAIAPARIRVALVALLILIAFAGRLLPSVNLFDYLVDPIGGAIAIGWWAVRAGAAAMVRLRRGIEGPHGTSS